jgi:hypothetical protein
MLARRIHWGACLAADYANGIRVRIERGREYLIELLERLAALGMQHLLWQ